MGAPPSRIPPKEQDMDPRSAFRCRAPACAAFALFAAFALVGAGCGKRAQVAPSTALAPPTATPPAASPEDALRSDKWSAELVARCTGFGGLTKRSPCELKGPDGGVPFDVCFDFSSTAMPKTPVVRVIVSRAHVDFLRLLALPDTEELLRSLPEGPERENMRRYFRERDTPEFSAIAGGRRVELRVLGMMMGGAATWGTLKSPRGTYETLLEVDRPLSDYPVPEDRTALKSIDITKTLVCMDASTWAP